MIPHLKVITLIAAVVTPTAAARQVDPAVCPLHAAHTQQVKKPDNHDAHAEMELRGNTAMGFDQSRASHHFRLAPDGGAIEIHTNSANDDATRHQVTAHLEAIAGQFKRGDFAIPHATHAAMPDGVDGMIKWKDEITYRFEPIASGGRVVIATSSPRARAAVHAFLRYQIREHRTGDPSTIVK